ncbi:MAG: hypothetical protein PHF00_08535 [Elusimicrobia bacterium]|nr:hypothetical protein [Elusimicrobiota bacterium]
MRPLMRGGTAPLLACVLAAAGWITAPLCFQRFLEAVLSGGRAWDRAALACAVVAATAGLELMRFRWFVRAAPRPGAGNSLPAKLAQLRIWATSVPNVATNLIVFCGGLLCLSLRDRRLALVVCVWAVVSYYLQAWIGARVARDARAFRRDGLREEESLRLQSSLLGWQVLGASASSVLKIGGQILICALAFGALIGRGSGGLSRELPAVLTNLEYVGMVLGGLQAMLSSCPQLRELKVYLDGGAARAEAPALLASPGA